MCKEKKETDFQKYQRERNKALKKRYDELHSEGYANTKIIEILKNEFDLYSGAAVYRVLKKLKADA